MSVLCPTACGAIATVVESYFDCVDVLRRYGHNHFILIKCDYQFTDISDDTEWAAAVASDAIHISPPGALVVPPPETDVVEIEGCGREANGVSTYNITFTTYQSSGVTNNAPDDVVYWRNLVRNTANYRLMWFDCDERLTVSDGWMDAAITAAGTPPITVTGSSPGLIYGVVQLPSWVEGEGDLGQWSVQFSVKKTGMLEQLVLPGVVAELA